MPTRRIRPLLAALAAVALVLAACAEQDDTADPVAEPDEEDAEVEEEAVDEDDEVVDDEAPTATLELATTDLGEHLVDGEGMTLYLFTEDPPGETVCYDDCADAWPPLLADGDVVAGDGIDEGLIGTITRDDGGEQVTYADQPLYYFAADAAAGDVEGQGVNDVWYVLAADGSAIDGEGGGDEDEGSGPAY